jgi:branched-chain amino acid aminotransferase
VIDLCAEEGITCKEEPMTLFEVYNADEMFLTGTAAELIPVNSVDGRKIGTGKAGPITKKLLAKYHERVKYDGYMI